MSEIPLTPDEGARLARLAAAAVAAELLGAPPPGPPEESRLLQPGACFVTLENQSRLRGCIGSLEASAPLWADATHNAVRAMTDPRLPPVSVEDWPDLDVKVAVLSAAEQIEVSGREDLEAILRPGIDGLVLTGARRRSTYLPVVWQKLTDPSTFVSSLLAKGGWPGDRWPDEVRVARYTSTDYVDSAPREALDAYGRVDR
jgi:AmmeMemoRadiSam system protein A